VAQQQYEVAVFGDNLTSAKYCVEIQDLRGVSARSIAFQMRASCAGCTGPTEFLRNVIRVH